MPLQQYLCLCAYYDIYMLRRSSFCQLISKHTLRCPLLPNALLMCAALLSHINCTCLQAYPCLCTYYAMYKLGRFLLYALVPRHIYPFYCCQGLLLRCLQAYPCLCAYYAIYKLGRFSFYLLVPRHTSPYSLLANAMLMCRFAPPLAFNFMAGIALPPGKSYSPGRDVTETVSCFELRCSSARMHANVMLT